MKRLVLLPILPLIAALVLTGCSGSKTSKVTAAAETPSASPQASSTAAPTTSSGPNSAANLPQLVEQERSSVVTVKVDNGEGSGVVWDDKGHIVTNNHVVEGTQNVTVILQSGESMPAKVLGTDPLTDLAVVTVDKQGLPPAEFEPTLPPVGEFDVAIGNPLGFESSVTFGIVSGLHRSIPSGGTTPALVDLLQTDAAISPGNSGGGLFDMSGKVIGINVAYIPPQQSAVSLGFAIPSATVLDVVPQLISNGTVKHAYLGIEPRPLTQSIAQQLGLSVTQGTLVFSVTPGSAAEKGGIQAGDVIVQFDGKDVNSVEDLYTALRDKSPGDKVDLKVNRGGQEKTLSVTLDARPASGQ